MAYTCATCNDSFQSAVGVTQHVALHHNTCAVCDETYDSVEALQTHTHESH